MAAKQFFLPYQNATISGLAEPGARVYFYATGTTTPQNVFTTAALTVPLANPVIANGAGHFVPIYMDSSLTYRVVVTDRNGVVLDDMDPYIPGLQGYELGYSTRALMAAVASPINKQIAYLGESGREGRFVFSTANLSTLVTADPQQGVYVAPSSDATGASGAWVRKGGSALDVRWFGAVADDVTNDYPAFAAAFVLMQALSITGFANPTFYRGGPILRVPTGKYYCASTLEPLLSCIIRGDGGKGWGSPSRIRFPAGVTGFRANAYNTSGASTVDGPHFAALNITLEDLYCIGAYDIAAPNEGEFHGFHAKVPVQLVRCTFDGFQGDGLYAHATSGGGTPNEGNTNLGRVIDCAFINNRNGRSMLGGDSNAWFIAGCRYDYNRAWGVDDTSFLGNTEVGSHCDSNGIIAGMPSYTLVSQGGNRYSVRDGFAAGASTNAPSGTATDNTWWLYCYAGGVSAGLIPAWFSGIAVREGGPYHTNNVNAANVFVGCYSESGQAVSQFTYPTDIKGGTHAAGLKGNGVYDRNYQGFSRFGNGDLTRGFIADGSSTVNGSLVMNGSALLGEALTINGASQPQLDMQVGGVSKGYVLSTGGAMYINSLTDIHFRRAGAEMVVLGTSYLYPATDNATDLGFPGTNRWKTLYGMTGTFATGITINATPVFSGGSAALLAAAVPAFAGGDVTSAGASLVLTIGNGAVSLAKMANLATVSLIGNATGGSATPTAITLAGGLSFSGTTITPTGGALAPASLAATAAITSSSASAGIGYATGAGGTVTQITSRTTGVTLNKTVGEITLVSAAGLATYQTFTVTNSSVAATDRVILNQKSGTDLYILLVTNLAAGSFKISYATTGGVTTEQPVIGFTVIKGVNA